MPGAFVTVTGCFVADLVFRTNRLPAWGETFMAGISVTRPGTAPSMPSRAEVDTLLKHG